MTLARMLPSFTAGLIFALGLGISGMTSPDKVAGFLAVSAGWDPSLMFVMVGAMLVYGVGYRLVVGRGRPLMSSTFFLPTKRDVDARLVGGAAIFGLGWGLAGYCPGPAIVSQVTLAPEALAFFGAMIAGMLLHGQLDGWRSRRADDRRADDRRARLEPRTSSAS